MLLQEWQLLLLLAGTVTALIPVSRQSVEESLNSALDAITRKQRSLDTNPQEYYNELRSFKYHGGDGERKFNRERPDDENRELDEEDEEIEFLPSDAGQLEMVGNDLPDINDKALERALLDYLDKALMDYLENNPQQEAPVTSSFRERERNTNRKRGPERLNNRPNEYYQELAKVILKNLLNVGHKYKGDRVNKLDEAPDPMSWGELMNKEALYRGQDRETDENEFDLDQDPNLLYASLAERRNVNSRYPIGRDMGTYRNMAKRYPISKRSPKPIPTKKQVTDPKVAQDLGALFGTQSTVNQSHTHNHDHDQDHDHEHNHEHNHDHEHDHEHDQSKHESSSESPKVSPPPKGQKENATKLNKSKNIEVRKKSVDWSQYFGMDRRRKKANFMAGQGTQNQDDDWMLQRYYENMVENLKANDRDYQKDNIRKDKPEQMNPRQKNIRDLIVEDALRYADSEEGADLQKVEDGVVNPYIRDIIIKVISARVAAAKSLEKMKKALNDRTQKTTRLQNNQTSSFQGNIAAKVGKKRSGNGIIENEASEENRICPELEAIEMRCKTADSLAGDESQMLYLPCVMLQICLACVQNDLEVECVSNYAVEVTNICEAQEIREGQKAGEACVSTALILMQLQPPAAVSMQCHVNGNESCLRRYHYRYSHRYLRYPYGKEYIGDATSTSR